MKPNVQCVLVSLVIIILHLLCSSDLGAQTTGSLSGVVTDTSGKKLAGAIVKVLGTSPLRGAITRADGSYLVAGIRAGEYDVQVVVLGYSGEMRPKIRIAIDQTTRLDVRLIDKPAASDTVVIHGKRLTSPTLIDQTMRGMTDPADLQRSARTSIQSAMALNSGVTTAGVNGISGWTRCTLDMGMVVVDLGRALAAAALRW
jgi:hypothetical protein